MSKNKASDTDTVVGTSEDAGDADAPDDAVSKSDSARAYTSSVDTGRPAVVEEVAAEAEDIVEAEEEAGADGSKDSLANVKHDPDEYQHAKKRLRRAVLECYRGLELLNNYRVSSARHVNHRLGRPLISCA